VSSSIPAQLTLIVDTNGLRACRIHGERSRAMPRTALDSWPGLASRMSVLLSRLPSPAAREYSYSKLGNSLHDVHTPPSS
jgi:hypothetical protein